MLHRALVLIRFACQAQDIERAEAIADAVHNLPINLINGGQIDDFEELFLTPLIEQYPDLKCLKEMLND
jgi:hypothetical protein